MGTLLWLNLRRLPFGKGTVAALFIFFVSLLNAADPFPKIWEIPLRDRLAAWGKPSVKDLDILDLGFSPDGRRLAIAFGNEYRLDVAKAGTTATYLTVVPVDHPETTLFWADLSQIVEPVGVPWAQLLWAPDGNSLAYQNVLIRLPGGERCRVRDWMPDGVGTFLFGGFLSPAAAVVAIPNAGLAGKASMMVATIDSHCRFLSRWDTNRLWSAIFSMSPDGRVFAVRDFSGDLTQQKLRLIEIGSKKTVDLRFGGAAYTNAVFINRGRLVCAVAGGMRRVLDHISVTELPSPNKIPPSEPPPRIPVRTGRTVENEARVVCCDARTGRKVLQSRNVWKNVHEYDKNGAPKGNVNQEGIPIALSAGRSLISMIDIAQQRWVWEFETDQVLASWFPESEDRKPIPTPIPIFPAAISPDGRLMADAGPGTVRLYRLP